MDLRHYIIRMAYHKPAMRPHLLRVLRQAATTKVPDSFPPTEIGLMTLEEFLKYRNPKDKFHPSDAYDFDFEKMNEDWSLRHVGRHVGPRTGIETDFYKNKRGYLLKREGDVIAVLHNGTLYIDSKTNPIYVPEEHPPSNYRDAWVRLPIKRKKTVKYISEYVPLVSDMARKNLERFPHRLQRIKVKGQYFDVRSEGPPQPNKGTHLAILDTEGHKVATAQDEWGATLIVVAQEYRGMGLGKVIGKYWYQLNPKYTSGGFSESGQENAIRLWKSRVREFLSRGWYSDLVRQGRLPQRKLQKILSDLGERSPRREEEPVRKSKPKFLFYVDYPTFVVYDEAFLEDPQEKYIYGYGFLRSDPRVGSFFFAMDYERKFQKLVTLAGFQMARDEDEDIYVGKGYGDMLELDNLSEIEVEGNYARLKRDVLPLQSLGKLERRLRRKADPYGEKQTLLLEMSESKWG